MSRPVGSVAAPPADASRVAAIRNSLDLRDKAACEGFGERAKREVVAGVDRLLSEVRTRDVIESSELLKNASGALDPLDPQDLIPKGGLSGLFSGREARLSRFRSRFDGAGRSLQDFAADLKERGERLARKAQALNHLHEQARTFILELDAYLEAGRAKLVEAVGQEKLAENAERLKTRLAELEQVRRAAVEQLPLVRMVQNIDAPISESVEQATAAIARWRADWSDRLGMQLDKRVRIRPDGAGLNQAKAELGQALGAVQAVLAEARARRAEAEEHMDRAARACRAASKG
ncbi:MAG: toxic anion resistance protein [Proteobacteria bacterium]|nr:toxic anion resistance protein [Pseudomonadota bacterium]